MTGLWLLLAILLIPAMGFIWWPFLRQSARPKDVAMERDRQNVYIFKQRLAELKQERENGNLDEASFLALQQEMENNLLHEVKGRPGFEQIDDDQRLKAGSERRNRWLALAMTLMVPLMAFGLYFQFGASQKLGMPSQVAMAQSMDREIQALEQRLVAEPENAEGWFLLGRTYFSVARYEDAHRAFVRLEKLVGAHPAILGQQAQALFFLKGNRMTSEIQALADRALKSDPQDSTTLGLLGINAYEQGDYSGAINLWQKILDSGREDVNRQGISNAITQARAQLPTGVAVNDLSGNTPGRAARTGQTMTEKKVEAAIRLRVEIAAELRGKYRDDQVVFVYAQPLSGPRKPLAAVKLTAGELPREVILNDSMAMGPMAKLSSVEQVQLRASISQSGNPGVQVGDLFGRLAPVQVRSSDENLIRLIIDQVAK